MYLVRHVLSLGYKFIYGVQALFFLALQIIAICINKKTHLSCRNNRRLNEKMVWKLTQRTGYECKCACVSRNDHVTIITKLPCRWKLVCGIG